MSIAIILASHGDFATGIKQTGDMFMGEQTNVAVCTLQSNEGPDFFREQVMATLNQFDVTDDVLFLVDLWGGTPFNQINQITQECSDRQMEIIAGLNLPVLLQAYSERFDTSKSVKEVVTSILSETKDSIQSTLKEKGMPVKNVMKKELDVSIDKNMSQLGITHVRLDERLIHGQVATLWIGNLGVNRVMVVDDNIVKDAIAKESLKTAVPGSVKLSILTTDSASKRLKNEIYAGQKVLVLVKDVETIFRLIDQGVPITQFNLGNASSKEGAIQIRNSLYLSEVAIQKILSLEESGIKVTAQMVPMEEEKAFSKLYRK